MPYILEVYEKTRAEKGESKRPFISGQFRYQPTDFHIAMRLLFACSSCAVV